MISLNTPLPSVQYLYSQRHLCVRVCVCACVWVCGCGGVRGGGSEFLGVVWGCLCVLWCEFSQSERESINVLLKPVFPVFPLMVSMVGGEARDWNPHWGSQIRSRSARVCVCV